MANVATINKREIEQKERAALIRVRAREERIARLVSLHTIHPTGFVEARAVMLPGDKFRVNLWCERESPTGGQERYVGASRYVLAAKDGDSFVDLTL